MLSGNYFIASVSLLKPTAFGMLLHAEFHYKVVCTVFQSRFVRILANQRDSLRNLQLRKLVFIQRETFLYKSEIALYNFGLFLYKSESALYNFRLALCKRKLRLYNFHL